MFARPQNVERAARGLVPKWGWRGYLPDVFQPKISIPNYRQFIKTRLDRGDPGFGELGFNDPVRVLWKFRTDLADEIRGNRKSLQQYNRMIQDEGLT